jgi:hypothetical protein
METMEVIKLNQFNCYGIKLQSQRNQAHKKLRKQCRASGTANEGLAGRNEIT